MNEYVTPISLSKLMVKLLDPQITDKIYDPFAGLGDTLITALPIYMKIMGGQMDMSSLLYIIRYTFMMKMKRY